MFVAQDDSKQHAEVDDRCDALKMEKNKLLDLKMRTDKTVEAQKEYLNTLQQCVNKR